MSVPLHPQRRSFVTSLLLVVMVSAIGITGILMVLRFSAIEEQRELLHWQNKLGLIADSRAEILDNWLQKHFHELGMAADNPSLQLYLTELESGVDRTVISPVTVSQEEASQTVFLRNLLLMTANHLDMITAPPAAFGAIRANVARPASDGIAIMDNEGKVIVSTTAMPDLKERLADRIRQIPKGKPVLIDMFISPAGERQIGFVLPIYPIQGDKKPEQQIGSLVAIKTIGDDFFKLLQQPGVTEKTLEAVLLRKEGENVTYLSPLRDGNARQWSLSTPELDAAFALSSPGSFAVKQDPESHIVLMTSRPIPASPWVLMLHVARNQALAESDGWRNKMEIILFFALVAGMACIIAAWWYGASRRAVLLSIQAGRLAARSVAQEKLLRLVADNQPDPVFIIDNQYIIRFSNARMASLFEVGAIDICHKHLAAVMGTAAASEYIQDAQRVLDNHTPLTRTHMLVKQSGSHIIVSHSIFLSHIPLEELPFPSPGVLVVERNVTEIVNERERRIAIQRQLVDTLVRLVDARDPYAGNHSALVAFVAREIALELGLDKGLVDTSEMAGRLMNIGKIAVPSAVLTKNTALAGDEIRTVRESLQASAVMLQGIDFEGAVVDTLKQATERFDGTGLLKLQGEEILLSARIIAVANSFIGMISPRSYRFAMDMKKATTALLQEIDRQFDRRIVVALINFLENKDGQQKLEKYRKKV